MSCGLREEVRSVRSSLISVVVSDSPAGWEAGAGAVGRADAPKLRKSPRGGSGAVLGPGPGGLCGNLHSQAGGWGALRLPRLLPASVPSSHRLCGSRLFL